MEKGYIYEWCEIYKSEDVNMAEISKYYKDISYESRKM